MFQGAFAILREKVPSVNYVDINIQVYPKSNNSRDHDAQTPPLLAVLYLLNTTR
jgi:hypothetical protein